MFKRAALTIVLLTLFISLSKLANAADSTKSAFATTNITSRYITVPVGTIVAWPQSAALPGDADPKWRECDGRSIPTSSDLYKQKGMGATPNLYAGKGYFLRASANPRNQVADTFRSHNHGQPSHTHYTTGGLTSTALTADLTSKDVKGNLIDTSTSGEAAPQVFFYTKNKYGLDLRVSYGSWHMGGGWGTSCDGVSGYLTPSQEQIQGKTHGGLTTGNVNNGAVTAQVTNPRSTGHVTNGNTAGTAHEAGGDDTYYTGDSETAPMHFTSRYFIRIND